MGYLRLCREQMAESGLEPASEDKIDGPNYHAALPSAYQVESARCVILCPSRGCVEKRCRWWRALEEMKQLTFHRHP